MVSNWVAGLAEVSPVESGPVGPAYEVRDLREGDEVFDFDFEVSLEGHPADTVAEGLRAADGVIEVHVEDRDVLLVRASGWDEGQLVRWLAANLQSS